MDGLNWLIHLYDNSMNGILADEVRGGRERKGGGKELRDEKQNTKTKKLTTPSPPPPVS